MPPRAVSYPVLAVERLMVEFATTDRVVSTVRGLSFQIARGETVAVEGRDIAKLADGALRAVRRDIR